MAAGGFDAGTDVSAGPTALSLRLADINGDGRPDLVAHHPTLQTVAVQAGQAGGTFAAPIHFPAPYSINPATELDDNGAAEDLYSVPSIGDLNGDGQLDIAVGDASGAIQVLFSTCGQPAGDLSVAVQDSADPVAEGESLTYAVTVTNHGPGPASGGILHLSIGGRPGARDAAPARFTSVSGFLVCVAGRSAHHVWAAGAGVGRNGYAPGQRVDPGRRDTDHERRRDIQQRRPDAGEQLGVRDDDRYAERPQHRGHEHERQRPRLAASGDRRVERGRRRPRHDRLQHPRQWRTHDLAAVPAAHAHPAGHHRRHDAARLRDDADHRAQWQRPRGSRAQDQRRQLCGPRTGHQQFLRWGDRRHDQRWQRDRGQFHRHGPDWNCAAAEQRLRDSGVFFEQPDRWTDASGQERHLREYWDRDPGAELDRDR